MKIAMLTSWDEPCGIADYSKALVAALQPLAEVNVIPLRHGQTDPAYFRQLGQACNQADLVHIQHEYIFFGGRDPWNYHFAEVLKILKKPYLITSHTWLRPFQGGPWWKQVLRQARQSAYNLIGWNQYLAAGQFQGASRLLVHTQAYARALRHLGIANEKLEVFPQGIPVDAPKSDAGRARQRWGISGPMVLIHGFLNPSKGHLLALAAWQQAPAGAQLVIAGKAFSDTHLAYAEQVAAAAKPFGQHVLLTGYLSDQDLADLLAAADLVLMPYTHSTSSYALSMALHHGCAVLTSDLECFREIRDQQPCLEIFPSQNIQALAKKINALLADSAKCRKLKAEARSWAQSHSWETIAMRLAGVYTQVLSENAKRSE